MTEARRILWLQPDDLNPVELCELEWHQVVYIFDPDWLKRRPHSLKQVQFIVESLEGLEKDVAIYHGSPSLVIGALKTSNADPCFVVEPRDVELLDHLTSLSLPTTLQWLPRSGWLSPPSGRFQRFFKYWNAVKKQI